jgi:hypothetical protein
VQLLRLYLRLYLRVHVHAGLLLAALRGGVHLARRLRLLLRLHLEQLRLHLGLRHDERIRLLRRGGGGGGGGVKLGGRGSGIRGARWPRRAALRNATQR